MSSSQRSSPGLLLPTLLRSSIADPSVYLHRGLESKTRAVRQRKCRVKVEPGRKLA